MCHFFLLSHYDTKYLQYYRGQCMKRTWQISQHIRFWKIQQYAKASQI